MKRIHFPEFFVIIVTFIIAVGIAFASYSFIIVDEVKHLPMTLLVDSLSGFNLDHDAIHFGAVPPGSAANREINLHSIKDRYVTIKARGPIAEFVSVNSNNFLLPTNSNTTLTLHVQVPPNTSYGWYNGTLVVYLKRWNI